MDNEKTANAIRSARLAAGYTQAQVAVKLGKSQTTIAAWETGRSQPAASTIVELAKLYGVSSDYLLGLSDYYSDTHKEVIKALFGNSEAPSFADQITQLIGKLSALPNNANDSAAIIDEATACISEVIGEFNKLFSCFIQVCEAYELGNSVHTLNQDVESLSYESLLKLSDDIRYIFSECAKYEKTLMSYDPAQFAGEALDSIKRVDGIFGQLALRLQASLDNTCTKFKTASTPKD